MKRVLSILSLTLLLGLLSGCISVPLDRGSRGKAMTLEMIQEPEGKFVTNQVLLVSLDGPLTAAPGDGGMFSGPSDLVLLKDALDRARRNEDIKAVLVRIDSPGGSVTASDLIYHEIKTFREEKDVPVVAVIMGMGASGGYYSAVAADHIMAHPTSLVGSIGVIGIFPNVQGLTGKLGIDMRVLKSGEFKDSGSMWRGFSPEEREILQGMIDKMHQRFVDIVDKGRESLTREQVAELANGRVYDADVALESGLIDSIGYMEDAFETALDLADIKDAGLVAYRMPHDYKGHYYAQNKTPGGSVNVFQFDLKSLVPWSSDGEAGSGPLHYIWMP